MRKVNWMSRSDHEFIPNYKVLQVAFDKNHIQKHINVELLIRGRFQDNLEFMQWMKCYWERTNCPNYDPLPAREGRPLPAWAKPSGCALRERASYSEGVETVVRAKRVLSRSPSDSLLGQQCPASPSSSPVSTTNNSESDWVTKSGPNHALTKSASSLRQSMASSQTVMELKNRLLSQQEELDDLRSTIDGLETERDYYFGKLREVEILCATQEAQMDPGLTVRRLLEDIQGILYAGSSNEESDQD
jgi:RP/EB family microtubule-associated protein